MRENNRIKLTKSSETYFINGMKGHNAITDVVNLGDDLYLLVRKDRPDLRVLIADIYIAGEADIYEINPSFNSIDAIILVGFFNHYSRDAKKLAKEMNVGLFDKREFYGAVSFTNEEFLNYERKEKAL